MQRASLASFEEAQGAQDETIADAQDFGCPSTEAACRRAREIGGLSYSSVRSILQNNLHRRRPETPAEGPAITHPNIRGASYFH